ncbi:MAG: dephospho-CoA kinase [Bacteroidia bacterium]|nr:dephospho-CoA kinase [Bacteroidia bacterium]
MLKIGLTGGIGSGKSTLAKAFAALGVPVFNADEETKKHLDDRDILSKIRELFGDQVLDNNGKVDRKKLSAIVFADNVMLNKLNELMHPVAAKAFSGWVARQRSEYVIKEAAILFESGADAQVDEVITVSCPESERITRVCKRDGVSETEVRSRMKYQWTDAQREAKSQYVILNDGCPVLEQVLHLHEQFRRKK